MSSCTDEIGRRWPGRAVLHVDLDAFFAAVEQLDHPDWRGRPVIVGGDPARRGVVSTASYEARAFGVRSAMASARAAALCPDAIWTRGDFARYREMSSTVMAIFDDVSPRVQPVSIDEAFIDVTPGRYSSKHPILLAREVRARIARLGITASVGVASSKSVAKIASDHNKPDGLTVVWPGDEACFLAPLPVNSMSGIGPRTAERLAHLGIRTVGDLARLDERTATEVIGSDGPRWVERARGIDPRPVHDRPDVKSVSNERTFSQDVRALRDVDRELRMLTRKVSERLQAKGLAGRTVTVKLRFSDFTTRTVRRTLDEATSDPELISEVAHVLLAQAWTPGVGLRLLGIGVSGFAARAVQLELPGSAVQTAEDARREDLVQGIRNVRRRFGADAVRFGAELTTPTDREDDE